MNEQDYGKCPFCGADKVLNPRTGKIFCSEKCWLKKSPQTNQTSGGATQIPNQQINALEAKLEAIEANIRRAFVSRDAQIKLLTERIEFMEGYNEKVKGKDPYIPLVENDIPRADEIDVNEIPF